MAIDRPCKYCKKIVYVNKSHVKCTGYDLAHISCHEDFNSHKSYCIKCGGEIIMVHSFVVTENLRIKKNGMLAKRSHSTDRVGEGTHIFNANCELCGETYEHKESNGIYTILGK
ncbi:hypothetical protein KQ41_06340 [Lysinibacillus fusiformis]|uniref:hypothetical protein n=1 Tax=Lysinibacillus fusiformis TaxID=28031 RepID=UPI0005037489|nr:hypothetical protein [Lysinibacillus fusiformis]KGA83662.1 hypothetical protein KQ41_06340 [Lysinibacillus fusiformis]